MTTHFASYDPITKAIHWIIAGAFFVIFASAFAMGADDLIPPDIQALLLTTHKTTGFLILCMMVFRIFWIHFHPAPPFSVHRFPRWQVFAARFVQDSLYTLGILTPFIGWVLVSMGSHGLKLFGILEMPHVFGMSYFKDSPEIKSFVLEFHETLATILACLLVVHVGATILHHFVDRDEILLRITPECTHPFLKRIRGN